MPDHVKPGTGLELRSRVRQEGHLELSLARVEVADPGPGEVIVRVEAAPINPTDLGMLLGPADPAGAKADGDGDERRLSIPLSAEQLKALRPRSELSLCPGLEGAGVVVDAGPGVQHLIGRTVAMFGGSMFAEYRRVAVDDCLVFPEGTAPAKVAASFVNPLTALAMVETMRREGHKAFVFTAAASNLGQMLNRLCLEEEIEIVNVVRRVEQVKVLRELGAHYICDSSAPDFDVVLAGMVRATGATLGFDAIGGGTMAGTILDAMEKTYAPEKFSVYGSTVMKQVYVYGGLDTEPLRLDRQAGMAWGVSGWLMMNRLAQLDPATVQRMRNRVARDLDGIFRSSFSGSLGLRDLLDPDKLECCARRSTGEKYLLNPSS